MLKYFFCVLCFFFATTAFAINAIVPAHVKPDMVAVYQKYKKVDEGKNADYIPELAKVNPALFGIAIVTVSGDVEAVGDVGVPFAIESISKVFTYAHALEDNGEDAMLNKVGMNATGHPFNSVMAIEEKPNHAQNPLVNAGAIQVTSLIKGKTSEEKWQRVLDLMKSLSDGKPFLGQAVYESETATNQHNRGIAELMASYGLMYSNPADALDRYTKACSVMVTTKQLAIMGAVLANKGINPMTHQRIFSEDTVRNVLSVMTAAGLCEERGIWWVKVGVPAKGGVGGGMIAVIPGKMAIAVFSPPLDQSGNSIRAQKVIMDLAKRWYLHMLD